MMMESDTSTGTEPVDREAPFTLDPQPWLRRIKAARVRRDHLIETWRTNVGHRVQRPRGAASTSDDAPTDRLSLPEDWARTKQKASQLNYQLPKIVAKAKHPDYEQKAPKVTADVNDVLRYECKAHYMIDECLADVINAAGFMASIIGLDRQTETYEIDVPAPPTVDALGNLIPSLDPPTKKLASRIVSQRFYWDRVSPADVLWPQEFRSSNWDAAPWLGVDSWLTLEQAMKTYGQSPERPNGLPKDFEPTSARPKGLSEDQDPAYGEDKIVRVTQLWYYAWKYDPDKAHPECVRRIVFVEGHEKPVEFDQTDWQEWVPEIPAAPEGPPGPNGEPGQPATGRPGYYKGLRKLPIRIETLAYVSDTAIPPSDTEAGRSSVRELTKSRTQMIQQRNHSVPIRWYNTNLLDPEVVEQIKRGEMQDLVPVAGEGSRAIGEVARASYPRENFQFQGILSDELDRAWSLSNNQLGSPNQGERSATEVNVVQSAGQVRLDYEKARVNRYFVEGAEVLFSLMQKFRNGTKYVPVPGTGPGGTDALQPIDPTDLMGEYLFDFVADSGDRIDTGTKQGNAVKLYNLTANSPGVNRAALEREIFELHGMDPAKVTQPVPPKEPEAPNVSYRFSGEDFLNPMVVAIALKAHPLTPEDIKNAAMMIRDSVVQVGTANPPPEPPPGQAPPMPPQGTAQPDVEPPETVAPILKRGASGERLV